MNQVILDSYKSQFLKQGAILLKALGSGICLLWTHFSLISTLLDINMDRRVSLLNYNHLESECNGH